MIRPSAAEAEHWGKKVAATFKDENCKWSLTKMMFYWSNCDSINSLQITFKDIDLHLCLNTCTLQITDQNKI